MSNVRGPALPGITAPINAPPPIYIFAVQSTAANLGGAAAITAYLPATKGHIRFCTFTSGAETIKVSGSKDGTNYTDLYPIDETTGNILSTVQLTTGGFKFWRIPTRDAARWRFFKFTKSAGANQGIVLLACASQEVAGGGSNPSAGANNLT